MSADKQPRKTLSVHERIARDLRWVDARLMANAVERKKLEAKREKIVSEARALAEAINAHVDSEAK